MIWYHDYMQVEYGGRTRGRTTSRTCCGSARRSRTSHKVKTPTMFIHGELRPRRAHREAEQMYIALKHVGVETVLLRYPREGHGLREPAHVVDALKRSLAWYGRFVKPVRGRPHDRTGGQETRSCTSLGIRISAVPDAAAALG